MGAAAAVVGSAQHEGCCTRVAEGLIGLEYKGHLRLGQMVLAVDGVWARLSARDRVPWLKECVARRDVAVVALRRTFQVSVGYRKR